MLTLRSLAMKPITEKMTKPAKMLVALLVQVTIRVSLEKRWELVVRCAWWAGRDKGKDTTCAHVSVCTCYFHTCICCRLALFSLFTRTGTPSPDHRLSWAQLISTKGTNRSPLTALSWRLWLHML